MVEQRQKRQRGALVTTSDLLVVAAMLLPFFIGRDVLAVVSKEESRQLWSAGGSKSISTIEASIARNLLRGKIFICAEAQGAAVVFASGLARPKIFSQAPQDLRTKPHFYHLLGEFLPGNGEMVDSHSQGMMLVHGAASRRGGSPAGRDCDSVLSGEHRTILRLSAKRPAAQRSRGSKSNAELCFRVGPVHANWIERGEYGIRLLKREQSGFFQRQAR